MSTKSRSSYKFSMDEASMERLKKECNSHFEFCEFAMQHYLQQEVVDKFTLSLLSELFAISYKMFTELEYLTNTRPYKAEKKYFLLTSEDAILVEAMMKAHAYCKGEFTRQTKVSLLEN